MHALQAVTLLRACERAAAQAGMLHTCDTAQEDWYGLLWLCGLQRTVTAYPCMLLRSQGCTCTLRQLAWYGARPPPAG